MSENVYVVTSGSYDDFHVEAIFSTRGEADAFQSELKKVDPNAAVDEWELDARAGEQAVCTYEFEIDLHGRFKTRTRENWRMSSDEHIEIDDQGGVTGSVAYGQSMVSAEIAKKIAVEAWQVAVEKAKRDATAKEELRAKAHESFQNYLASGGKSVFGEKGD